jgi:uncharacterized protein YbaR (Trm112 family)
MHILLTDVLTCPRCGPEFGLILLADEMRERVVTSGRLGCANCRERFPIEREVVDLRLGDAGIRATAGDPDDGKTGETAYRIAALLGVTEQPAAVLLVGHEAAVATAVAGLLPDARITATAPAGDGPLPEGCSWLRHGERLPLRTGSMRGVALHGEVAGGLLEEAARLLQGGGRLVLDPAPAGAADRLEQLGLELLLEQDGVVVASLSRAR